MGVDMAIPCGIILNELVSNSLKHAFPSGRSGEIRIHLSWRDGQCSLAVKDDGVGLPPDLDPYETQSLGMTIIRALTDQLAGTLKVSSNGGAEFTITFPYEK